MDTVHQYSGTPCIKHEGFPADWGFVDVVGPSSPCKAEAEICHGLDEQVRTLCENDGVAWLKG